MSTPLSRVITNEIFRVPARRKRKQEPSPSEIPSLRGYTAGLVDKKWLRLSARGKRG
nr:MAG TPA_asm: NinE [Caudoviricetes sp.]